jgi:branched-subunit amino acid aminotransferase/4-amino-4-deoxychorismate lyase
MENGKYFCFNENIFKKGKAVITADNRSFRFGDGFFETMKMIDGNIPLSDYHFERLFTSLQLLKFEIPGYFTAAYLSDKIKKIVFKNNHAKLAAIRLTIFRGDGSLYEYENDFPNFIIQTRQLNLANSALNKNGLVTGVYTKARKTCDDFSHIKNNNFLPYVMAALWAKEKKLDDAIVLNNYNRIADATIANIFLVKDGKIKTPALTEGCISGVMRKYIIQSIKKENIPFEETAIETEELAEANELFLSNAVKGINRVKQCENFTYGFKLTEYLQNKFVLPLFKVL